MLASIIAALASLGQLANLLSELISAVKQLNLTIEEKQITEFKKGVNETLEQIKISTNDDDRKRLLVELSKRLSK